MQHCGLVNWRFGWDRAIRRLGCCRLTEQCISLSKHFVACYMDKDKSLVWQVVLHELAHALAWEKHRQRGHGAHWKHYCAQLGIPDAPRTVVCDSFAPEHRRSPQPHYILCHDETGEIFRRYFRKPKRSASQLKHCYMPGRKQETFGHLVLRKIETPE